MAPRDSLQLRDRGPGRPLHIQSDGTLRASRGYRIYRSTDDGASWSFEASLPIPPKRLPGRFSRLAARLLRFEVRALVPLADGRLVVANRDGVYCGPGDGRRLDASVIEDAGQPVKPPFNLCVGPGGEVLWGEYNGQRHDTPVRLYASRDGGRSFEIVHVFARSTIQHVHSLRWDPTRRHYWVFCGDFDEEPGIGMLSADLACFEWLVKGEQRYRLCEAFDLGDRLVYATDTPLERNAILSLDKASGRTEKLRDVEGSCLYACRFGDWLAFSTTVEAGAVDATRSASLWLSRDGEEWECALSRARDRWPELFQFGSLLLPRGASDRDTIWMGGQGVRGLDGRLQTLRLAAE